MFYPLVVSKNGKAAQDPAHLLAAAIHAALAWWSSNEHAQYNNNLANIYMGGSLHEVKGNRLFSNAVVESAHPNWNLTNLQKIEVHLSQIKLTSFKNKFFVLLDSRWHFAHIQTCYKTVVSFTCCVYNNILSFLFFLMTLSQFYTHFNMQNINIITTS